MSHSVILVGSCIFYLCTLFLSGFLPCLGKVQAEPLSLEQRCEQLKLRKEAWLQKEACPIILDKPTDTAAMRQALADFSVFQTPGLQRINHEVEQQKERFRSPQWQDCKLTLSEPLATSKRKEGAEACTFSLLDELYQDRSSDQSDVGGSSGPAFQVHNQSPPMMQAVKGFLLRKLGEESIKVKDLKAYVAQDSKLKAYQHYDLETLLPSVLAYKISSGSGRKLSLKWLDQHVKNGRTPWDSFCALGDQILKESGCSNAHKQVWEMIKSVKPTSVKNFQTYLPLMACYLVSQAEKDFSGSYDKHALLKRWFFSALKDSATAYDGAYPVGCVKGSIERFLSTALQGLVPEMDYVLQKPTCEAAFPGIMQEACGQLSSGKKLVMDLMVEAGLEKDYLKASDPQERRALLVRALGKKAGLEALGTGLQRQAEEFVGALEEDLFSNIHERVLEEKSKAMDDPRSVRAFVEEQSFRKEYERGKHSINPVMVHRGGLLKGLLRWGQVREKGHPRISQVKRWV